MTPTRCLAHQQHDAATAPKDVNVEQLLDVRHLQELLEQQFALTGMPITLLERNGYQFAAAVSAVASERCACPADKMEASFRQASPLEYQRQSGLWEIVVPIAIDKHPAAALRLGPFCYDDALPNTPSFSREQVRQIAAHALGFVRLLSEMGAANLKLRRDIAQRIQAENALRESEQRFYDLFASMIEGVAMHHLVYDDEQRPINYVVEDVNPAFEAQTGISADTVRGKFSTVAYDADVPPYFDIYCQVAETGTPVVFDAYFPPLKKHFHISVFSPEHGRFTTIFEDVTEQKHSEQILHESEERFRSVIENTQAGYFFIDTDGYFRNVNAAWLKLYKYDRPEDVIGKHFTDVQKIDDVEKAAAFVTGIMRGDPQYLTGEFSRKCKDDTIGYHLFSARPVRHDDEVIGIEGFIIDTTERRYAEEEILRLNAELDERVRQRTTELESAIQELKNFAHIVSHDLKAPLRNINQLSHWLVEDYGASLDAEGQKLMALLIDTSNHMDHLINGILEYSRIGRAKHAAEMIDLNVLVTQIIRTLSVPAQTTISISSTLPTLRADHARLTQVFQNLLENALKFQDKTNGMIRVSCDDTPTCWQFCVEDNGPGIAPIYHEKIFQLFQTLDVNAARKSTGIGLSVVKKIIEFYGGRIWIESEIGHGSKFVFTLPKSLSDCSAGAALNAAASQGRPDA